MALTLFTQEVMTQARATTLPLFNLVQMTLELCFAHYLQVKMSALFIKLISSYVLISSSVFRISVILKFHFDVSLLGAEVFR